MKILFILGFYRPGKCGISDYVRLLSKQLEFLGHECSMININLGIGDSIATISESLPQCDVVSLQFSPYSFHPKGLPGKELNMLGKALAGHHLQVMFHEIWIGAYPKAKLYERWVGGRQRKQVLRFIGTANPFAIHSTNSAALNRLKLMGIDAKYLYLCGNIPWGNTRPSKRDDNTVTQVVFFGTPYYAFPYDLLFDRLNKSFIETNKSLKIRVLGNIRNKAGLEKLHKEANKYGFAVKETGMLTTEEISYELQAAQIGVATTPYDILGKSGAAAAMMEHGLPIYTYDDGDTPRDKMFIFDSFKDQIFLLNDRNNTKKLLKASRQQRKPFFNGVVHTTEKFLESVRRP